MGFGDVVEDEDLMMGIVVGQKFGEMILEGDEVQFLSNGVGEGMCRLFQKIVGYG